MNVETFHFLRPAWLLAGLALLPIVWLVRRERREAGAWQRVCDPALLAALLVESGGRTSRWALPLFSLGWFASALAMAGPSWERLPQPTFEIPRQTVLVLDLATSMRATDVEPSRVARARFELADLLERVEGGVALVLYAEDAYAVTPISDDPDVVAALLPVLEPGLMPGRGERLDRAIEEARLLLERAGASEGRIVVLADGLGDHPDDALEAARRAAAAGFRVAVLGIAGDSDGLADLAGAGGGTFAALAPDDRDVEALLVAPEAVFGDLDALSPGHVKADVWEDMGAWLLWLPLLLAPLAFRRGWAMALVAPLAMGVLVPASSARAADWEPWLWRGDQRGAQAFEAGEHARAADLFEDAAWRAAAQYRGGDYAGAASSLREQTGPEARYNLGNALAQSGDLQGAIAAYDEALSAEPGHDDAQYNRDLVEKLLEEEQREPESEQSEESGGQDSEDSQGSQGSEGAQDSEGSENAGAEAASDATDDAPGSDASEPSEGASASDASGDGEAGEVGAQAEGASEASETAGAEATSAGAEESRGDAEAEAASSGSAGAHAGEDSGEAEGSQAAGRVGGQAPSERGESGVGEGEKASEREARASHADSPGVLSESDQEVEQWLNRVPDDPGGLLREKLRRRYAERRARGIRGEL